MTKQEAISKAIGHLKGREVLPGTIVAAESDPIAYEFKKYDGDAAVCLSKEGAEIRFPRTEIFECNKVLNIANHYLNLGFWSEGMESITLTSR